MVLNPRADASAYRRALQQAQAAKATTELLVWQRSQLLRLPRDQQHKREPCLPQFAKALLRGRRPAGGPTLAASKTRERDRAPEPCPVFPGFIQLSWFIRCPRKSKSAITPGLATAWCHRHDLPTAALDRENGGDWLVNGGMRPGRKTTERKCSSRRSRARVCSTSLGTALPLAPRSVSKPHSLFKGGQRQFSRRCTSFDALEGWAGV